MCGLALAFAPAPVAEASGANLSGDYDDQGEILSGDVSMVGGVVSLHALFALEFDPGRAQLLHAQTTRVRLGQSPDIVEITAYDADGQATPLGRWRRGGGYVPRGASLQLSTRGPDATYVFTLEPARDGAMLRLTVRREKKSVFGPGFEDIGAFVFARRMATPSGK
ncbi:MAG: hypothetical protein C0502_06435 [Opitutus sp.]|nr:hypothetical protein [Opitutus sp.]